MTQQQVRQMPSSVAKHRCSARAAKHLQQRGAIGAQTIPRVGAQCHANVRKPGSVSWADGCRTLEAAVVEALAAAGVFFIPRPQRRHVVARWACHRPVAVVRRLRKLRACTECAPASLVAVRWCGRQGSHSVKAGASQRGVLHGTAYSGEQVHDGGSSFP